MGTRDWLTVSAAAIIMLSGSASAAQLDGVTLPDAVSLDGTELHLNGIALRTYSWLGIHIYVAGLYLEHPSHDAEAILDSPEKKLLAVRFVHNVDVANARQAWREGFEDNCRAPCHLAPSDVERFLAAMPSMRAGDHSTLAFTREGLKITMNGKTLATITDPMFSRAVLATFIGPKPPTPRLKRELLHNTK
jgi:Chalcone isomerase-like